MKDHNLVSSLFSHDHKKGSVTLLHSILNQNPQPIVQLFHRHDVRDCFWSKTRLLLKELKQVMAKYQHDTTSTWLPTVSKTRDGGRCQNSNQLQKNIEFSNPTNFLIVLIPFFQLTQIYSIKIFPIKIFSIYSKVQKLLDSIYANFIQPLKDFHTRNDGRVTVVSDLTPRCCHFFHHLHSFLEVYFAIRDRRVLATP